MRFSVVSWNIHKGIGGIDRRYRPERVIGVLLELAPDVALLQEVADEMPRSHFHDQAEMRARHWHATRGDFSQHRFRHGGYGNCILSRWPLSNVHTVDLTIGTRKSAARSWRVPACASTARAHGRAQQSAPRSGRPGTRAFSSPAFLDSQPFKAVPSHAHRAGRDLNDLWGTLSRAI
jgi:endonuclease/exonuclease/phosphatase family metal-dependent hydrolase